MVTLSIGVDCIPQITLGPSNDLIQLPVPHGKNYRVEMNVRVYHASGGALVFLRNPDCRNSPPSWNSGPLGLGTGANNQSMISNCTVVTDKHGRIAASAIYSGTICNISIVGWEAVALSPILSISTELVASGGRIDAVADFGGTIFAGTRSGVSTSAQGKVYKLTGSGWVLNAALTAIQGITCLFAGNSPGQGFALGHLSDLWETTDNGDTWTFVGRVSSRTAPPSLGLSYSGCVTSTGTILIATSAGYIYRKAISDSSFEEIFIDASGVYRLMKVGDGVICNTWSGKVDKSDDDGETWAETATLSSGPLYAIEYCGNGRVLIGSGSGKLYESSDNADTFIQIQILDGEADDFCAFGDFDLYTTYTGQKNLYLRTGDDGFRSMGSLPNGDWLDHTIKATIGGNEIAIGGTSQGYIATIGVEDAS